MIQSRRVRLLLAPFLAGLLVIGGGLAAIGASSDPSLPPVATDRLVASVLEALASRAPVSGKVDARVDLGLPQPFRGALAQEAGGVASLLGDHRLRIWRSADGFRVSELLPIGERSLLVSRSTGEAWAWDSESFTAFRLGRIQEAGKPYRRSGGSAAHLMDPLELARRSLQAASPSTRVEVRGTTRVAGRDAYLIVLEPRTSKTLAGRIEIGVDAERRVPLRVAVHPRGGDGPAISAAFTAVDFGPIDPSVYAFSPPPEATVKDVASEARRHARDHPERGQSKEMVLTFGDGWITVVAIRLPPEAVNRLSAGERGGLSFLPLSSNLLSIRLANRADGSWLLYGAVPQSALIEAEAKLP